MVNSSPQLRDLAEVAAQLRVTERFLRKEIAAGRLRAMKAGAGPSSPFRFRQEWVDEYIEARVMKPKTAVS